MSTPTTISPRNPGCRLCGDSRESRYMLRIYCKAGSEKDLCAKVHNTCGIKISEDDTRSKVLCRRVYSESSIPKICCRIKAQNML